jgi:hypothetical protein
MAHETAVHRVDVESASNDVTPVVDDLAIDGIDELVTLLPVWEAEEAPVETAAGTVAVRTLDHMWRLTLGPGPTRVEQGPGHSDAVVSGEPSELALWLWGRRPDTAVLHDGDQELVKGLRRRLAAASQ